MTNITVDVQVEFDEAKVEALIKEFKERLIKDCVTIKAITAKPNPNIIGTTIEVHADFDVEAIAEGITESVKGINIHRGR